MRRQSDRDSSAWGGRWREFSRGANHDGAMVRGANFNTKTQRHQGHQESVS
jgi:hypothetical protein